jgi:hypothetical protein
MANYLRNPLGNGNGVPVLQVSVEKWNYNFFAQYLKDKK